MSHNINTYNTNAFDVVSNQTVTIGTTQEFMCNRSSLSQIVVVPTAGNDVRIPNGHLINALSGLTINYDSTYTSHAYSYTLANNGTYLINASVSFYYNNTAGFQSYAIYEGGSQISNTSHLTQSNIDYPYNALMSTIVVVSGSSSKTVSVRCLSANRIENTNNSYINGFQARTNHFTIWKLK
jgi:hypothetical protein